MWVVRMSDKQLEVLRALLHSEEHLGPTLKGAVEALDLARWDELPEAELPWDEIEATARHQGCSPASAVPDDVGRRAALMAGGRFDLVPGKLGFGQLVPAGQVECLDRSFERRAEMFLGAQQRPQNLQLLIAHPHNPHAIPPGLGVTQVCLLYT